LRQRNVITMMQQQQTPSIIVEGNIGAGKSTFLQLIKDQLRLPVIFEPHQKWQGVDGQHNLLDAFYREPQRWAYTFQTYAFISRIMEQERYTQQHRGQLLIIERSVFSDRYCFAKTAYENGNMTLLEWKLYQEWFAWLVERYLPQPTGFIYLKTDPVVCHGRMAKRNRSEEQTVSLAYLQQLHEEHERWLINKEGLTLLLQSVPVLTLLCNEDFEHDAAVQLRHMDAVTLFITTIGQKPVTGRVQNFSTSFSL
jgi:deoxyguanosine kinase